MGDMADYYGQEGWDELARDDDYIEASDSEDTAGELEPGAWMTRDGRKLRISEMENGHLLNAFRMMKRKGFIGWRVLSSYLGKGPNGEMAQLAFQEEADEVFRRPYHPAMDELEDEITKRGLNGGG